MIDAATAPVFGEACTRLPISFGRADGVRVRHTGVASQRLRKPLAFQRRQYVLSFRRQRRALQ